MTNCFYTAHFTHLMNTIIELKESKIVEIVPPSFLEDLTSTFEESNEMKQDEDASDKK